MRTQKPNSVMAVGPGLAKTAEIATAAFAQENEKKVFSCMGVMWVSVQEGEDLTNLITRVRPTTESASQQPVDKPAESE